MFFQNGNLTSIRIGFCLNKSFVTHFGWDYVDLYVFWDSKQGAVDLLIKNE